jgi:glycosyltransferase involved in cell wall biosynthesis
MPRTTPSPPKISVVIPTYNRCEMLRRTLWTLARQGLPREDYEVIVADDGSSDATADAVRSFHGDLDLTYHFQEDLGFRAAQARNAGARAARGEVLVFMDTGTLAGPDMLAAHLDAQKRRPDGLAVIGDTYGYRPHEPTPGLEEAICSMAPEEVMARYRDVPTFWDWRRDEMVKVDDDINRRVTPWLLFWATNVSVRADVFVEVGGFHEGFRGWGVEDIELGFRLHRRGLPFLFSHEAWAIETPHDRDPEANLVTNQHNADVFTAHDRHPAAELTWGMYQRDLLWEIEDAYREVLDWTERAKGLTVGAEIEAALTGLPPGASVAVLGCGDELPPTLPPGSLLADVDEVKLARAVADGRHEGVNLIGVRTPFPDGAVDAVLVTSRLEGLWNEWAREILAEARRIGRSVRCALPVPDGAVPAGLAAVEPV